MLNSDTQWDDLGEMDTSEDVPENIQASAGPSQPDSGKRPRKRQSG